MTSQLFTQCELQPSVIFVNLRIILENLRKMLGNVREIAKISLILLPIYYMAELVQGEKEHSDWFPEQSEFCYMDC